MPLCNNNDDYDDELTFWFIFLDTKKLVIDVADDDDEEFELFLKSVQTKASVPPQVSSSSGKGSSPQTPPRSLHSITSDNDSSEEEIDFGYWEKASVPKQEEGTRTDAGNLRELDLDLL